jgi:hypothetical protein
MRSRAVLLPIGPPLPVQSDARRMRGTVATDHWQILTPRSALMHTKNPRRPSRAVIVAVRREHPVNLAD